MLGRAITSTDYGADTMGIFGDFLKEVESLGSGLGWGFEEGVGMFVYVVPLEEVIYEGTYMLRNMGGGVSFKLLVYGGVF